MLKEAPPKNTKSVFLISKQRRQKAPNRARHTLKRDKKEGLGWPKISSINTQAGFIVYAY